MDNLPSHSYFDEENSKIRIKFAFVAGRGDPDNVLNLLSSINIILPDITIGDWTWGTFNDSDNGGTSTINIVEDKGAVVISGNVTDAYDYGFAGVFANPNADALANIKTATSISFKVIGDGKTYKLILPTSDITDYSYYYATFTATETEITVTIPIESLTSPGWGESSEGTAFNQSAVNNIQWQTDDGASGPFSLTISDLTLVANE
jgi:hypothetical protein